LASTQTICEDCGVNSNFLQETNTDLRIIRTGAELQVKKYSHACHKSFATSDAAEAFMQARMQTNYLIPSTNTEATTPLGSNGTGEDELVARLDVVTLGRS
jgi:hypothetical protein